MRESSPKVQKDGLRLLDRPWQRKTPAQCAKRNGRWNEATLTRFSPVNPGCPARGHCAFQVKHVLRGISIEAGAIRVARGSCGYAGSYEKNDCVQPVFDGGRTV
jgi:hypothetical protein